MINPHDYELTDEESEALLLKSEHAIAPPLSPAASAVLDATHKYKTQAWSNATHERFNQGVAAALRAAALYCKQDRLRLLVIAEELDGL